MFFKVLLVLNIICAVANFAFGNYIIAAFNVSAVILLALFLNAERR